MIFSMRIRFILAVFVMAATLVAVNACGGSNHPPVITGLSANPATVSPSSNATITCAVTDADSDQLSYMWTGTGGSITGNGSSVVFTAPSVPGTYSVNVVVSDGRGGMDTRGVAVTVLTVVTTGSIAIASTPAGAAIYIDGADTGSVTPLTLSNLDEGEHSIKLTYYHYVDKTGTVTVSAGETNAVNWPLTWAEEQTLTIQPNVSASKDAPVFQDHPNTNYNDNHLAVGQHSADTQARSYLQFNLNSIPSGAVIVGSRLGLWYSYSDVLSSDASVGMYKVTGSWNASAVNWNYQPSRATAPADTITVPADPTYDFIYWDILDLVNGWCEGSIANNGVLLAAVDESAIEGARIFISSVGLDEAQRPKLEITYFIP